MGRKTKVKTGGKKFDEQKYERKIRAPGDKLFIHQFQTAERILAPDWAENFSAQSGASIRPAVWNWYINSLSPGARIFLSYFCSSNFFPPVLTFVFGPTICPWVSEDAIFVALLLLLLLLFDQQGFAEAKAYKKPGKIYCCSTFRGHRDSIIKRRAH